MKKLKRVFGSVANLSSGRDDQSSADPPIPLSSSRKSISGSVHGLGDHRGSYVSYESQSLDSFNSIASAEIDPYSKQDKNFTKLHKWAYIGDVVKLKKFIKKIPVDLQDGEGKTALHHAAAQGRGDTLLFLLGSKGNVELKDNNGMTPFLRAVERSQLPVVQMLVQRKVDVNVTDNQGNSSCHLAARTGAVDLLTLLLDCGGDCDATNSLGRTPLHLACSENQQEIVENLLRHGSSVNVTDKEGVTPLMMAAKVGSAPLVETLLEHGADVSNFDSSKWSAADYARFTNHNQLHHRLSGLMEKGKSSGLFSSDLLNVSDEGNSLEEEGSPVLKKKEKTSDDDGAADSWSDTSEVNSIKEKPKINLLKFLPSSDDSADNAVGNVSDSATSAVGPPKPPRLYASSSSIASAGMDEKDENGEKTHKNTVEVEEEDPRTDDSWKSSSDEEPLLKPLSLFPKGTNVNTEMKERESSLDMIASAAPPSRMKKEDLVAELGLDEMEFHSSEEVSFDDEYAVLPIEDSAKPARGSRRSSLAFIGATSDKDSLPVDSSNQEGLQVTPQHSSRSSVKSNAARKVTGTSESPLSSSDEDVKKKPYSSRKSSPRKSPKKMKPVSRKSGIDDSDTEEEERPRCHSGRKTSTPSRKNTGSSVLAGDVHSEENDEENSASVKSETPIDSPLKSPSKGDMLSLSKIDGNGKSKKKVDNIASNLPDVSGSKLSVFPEGHAGSGSSTLSTVAGTLGREGTMQEMEEMWEANPSVRPKHSCSESSAENSEDQSKSLGKESHPLSDGLAEMEQSAGAEELDTLVKQDQDKIIGKENISDSEDNYMGEDVNDAVVREADSINAVGSNSSRSTASPGSRKSPTDISNKFIRKSSVPKEELSIDDGKQKVVPKEKGGSRKEKEENRISSGKSNSDKMKNPSVTSTSPSRRGSRTGTGRTSGFGSIVFSDEDSISQDLLTTPGFMEDIDDVISAASTETEESTHINSGLKDSLLTPLSSLPDAADVNQLQDLVRELRLKLEKEFGRRAALETRHSKLRQQEKQTRSQNNHLEQDIQRMEQEVSSLTARIKQLEYLGQCEQDSSRLKDQSLEEFHLRCEELEEQCGTLCTNALHQEQLVESLMVQLQTKERVNQSLQSRLEDISSQTKYVSMKSCQTEEILADALDNNRLINSVEVSVQTVEDESEKVATDLVANNEKENDSEIVNEKLCSECMKLRDQIALETTDISLQTEIEIQSETDKSTLVCVETQTLQSCKDFSSTGVQCVPDKVMKTSQTYNTAQSHQSQTEMTNDNSEVILKKSFNESTCQTSFLGKVAMVQTENMDFSTDVQQVHSTGGQTLNAAEVASTLEPVLQNFFQDFKSLMFEAMEGNQNSLQETMNKSVTNQINDLKGNMENLLKQKSVDQTHETELKFKELSQEVNEILQRQVDTVTEVCGKTTSNEKSNVHEVLMQTHDSLESKFHDLRLLVEQIKQNQGSGEEKIGVHLESILKDAGNSSQKIMKTLADFQGENLNANNEVCEKFSKLMSNLADIQKSIQDLINSEDRSFSEDNMKDIINRLNLVEKSLLQSIERNHVSQDISSLESELCKINDGIHKKLSTLQVSMQAAASSGGVDEEVLDLCLEKLRENNKQLLNVFRAKASESTTNISEVIEENFHIIQEHLRKVQQSLAQRLNELSQDFSHTEDKMSCTSKQINDMSCQVTSVQNNLLHIQSSLEALQSMPSAGGFIDEALLTSLRAGNEQVASSLSFQYQSIIQLLESLQKEVHNAAMKAHGSEDKTELRLLKERLCEKEEEISSLCGSQESLQKKLREKASSLEHSQRKEEELQQKLEGLLKQWHQSENTLRETEEELKREKLKAASHNDNFMKLQQENFQLSTENTKLSSRLSSEQHQKNLYESEWQSHRDAREAAETRVQDLMIQLNQQRLQVQRTPPSGRDKEDDIILAKQKEIQELEVEKRKIETLYKDQCTKLQHIELQLKETEAQLVLEQSNRDDLEKQLKKTKNSVERLQKSLTEASVEHGTLQDLEDRNKELEETLKSNEMAMDALRKKLESIVKEKLLLKQDIMLLREEKLSFEMIKQERDIAEEMQRKMETQLQLLHQKISDDYVPKMRLNHLKKELEQKYQLELSTRISELNHLLKEQSHLQESQVKAKESEEQGLKVEISRLSEETVRLRALLSIHEEEKDSWKVRHDRLMNLYQQQAPPQHYLQKSSYPKKRDDSLSINLREINAHLQSPLASSTLLGRLTPPTSLNPPKAPGNIDSYHYTHSDSMDRMLQKCLKAAENDHSRYLSTSDDKPHARISPMQTSQSLQDSLPSMDKSCKAYVDLLNKKYCL